MEPGEGQMGNVGQWGGAGNCDFNGGGVGINDLLDMLAAWGPYI